MPGSDDGRESSHDYRVEDGNGVHRDDSYRHAGSDHGDGHLRETEPRGVSGYNEPWWAMLIARSGAMDEDETDYDGFLSYATEFHAVAIGFSIGFTVYSSLPSDVKWLIASVLGVEQTGIKKGVEKHKAFREMRDEPWYFFLGLFVGLLLGAIQRMGVTGVIETTI